MALHCEGVGFGRLLEGMRRPFPRQFCVIRRMTCGFHEWQASFIFTDYGKTLLNPRAMDCTCGREGAVKEATE